MKSSFKKIKGSKVDITVTLAVEEFKPYWETVYNNALAKVTLKGFRPGTAPKALADQALDHPALLEQALQDAIRRTLQPIVDENNWTAIDRPEIEVTSDAQPLDGGVTYVAHMTIFPEVKLGDYKKAAQKIVAEPLQVEVSEKEIEQSFMWLRKSRAPMTRVTRGMKQGDVVEIDIHTTIDGKTVQGGDLENDRFEFGEGLPGQGLPGQGKFIPGFEKEIEGRKEGEEVTFQIVAPKDYWQKELCNKTLDFKVRVKSVFELQLPEANDEFAASVGAFKTIAEVKASIVTGLKTEKEQHERDERRGRILEAIVKGMTIEIPEVLIERTLDQMLEEFKPTIEAAKLSPEEARKRFRDTATKRVSAHLALYDIAKRESLEPSKEEIEAESVHHQRETNNLDAGKFYDYIYGILLNRKVFEFLEQK